MNKLHQAIIDASFMTDVGGASYVAKVLFQNLDQLVSTDEEGRTPLHLAANLGSVKVVELLLQQGADKEARDNAGRIPKDVAGTHCRHLVDPITPADTLILDRGEYDA